jgi:hypothetical protein
MNRTTKILSVAAAIAVMGLGGGAWAADCGDKPALPNIPADGAAASSKDMEKASEELETYSNKFAAFNDCAVKEYNETLDKWKTTLAAYQAKSKK